MELHHSTVSCHPTKCQLISGQFLRSGQTRSTWFVPGSHLRRDLPQEAARFPDRPIDPPELEGKSAEEREYAGRDYCRSMPGAVQAHLEAGDYCLYRNSLWHLGNYVPYRKRATIHDGVMTPEFVAWSAEARAESAARREAGYGMENPNASRGR